MARLRPNVKLETPFGPLRLDAYWREFGFGLELDSWAHHQNRDAFERDRLRVLAADAIGVDVKRVTWRMLVAPAMLENLLNRRLLPHQSSKSTTGSRRSR